jgi:prophage regulatory protein
MNHGSLQRTTKDSKPLQENYCSKNDNLLHLQGKSPPSFQRTIRRTELRQLVPLADTTIYDMEKRGEFPRRFNLTPRCVVWDLAEVEAWLAERRLASEQAQIKRAPSPDVRQRKTRPVKSPVSS